MTTTSKRDQPITRVSQHLIEFVADANVFAMMGLDQASALNWNLTSDTPVHFSSGLSERAGWRFIHVCVPKYDYYEYLEVKGTEIKMPLAGKDSYLGAKRDFFRATEAGYIHKLKDYKLAE